MLRKIIHIDEEKCNGCGACASACHEGAIGMVDGKARLLREHYCDGLGDCLPACPTGAITFEEREAPAYDAAAVAASRAAQDRPAPFAGCPGSRARAIARAETETEERPAAPAAGTPSRLRQWPVQIKLMPVKAPYYDGADLLIAADCAAYAYGAFHRDFIKNRITLIGCPKLDGVDYADKLTEILRSNDIRSLTVVRMEVPCCGGLELAAKTALQRSGRFIPWQVVTLSADGRVLE
jgi:Fe-S-cluster-containing hydrogenase component 2